MRMLAVLLMLASNAAAISPSLSVILPRGGQRGTEVEVNFHGGNLADTVGVMFHEPGIELVEVRHKEAGRATCLLRTHQVRRNATRIRNGIVYRVFGDFMKYDAEHFFIVE